MLGLHMVLNKVLHNRYLTCSEYRSSSEYASVAQGSVEHASSTSLTEF